ncbi:hypothetical protein HAX54_034222 [Datura stramonium]|uniref:Uncharacterized protein n=1 Tax=Datura stramonium TaxID=4076 RepID=A0ABS8VF13_DATST|nr:hypothetical protein [Datura stramonium]
MVRASCTTQSTTCCFSQWLVDRVVGTAPNLNPVPLPTDQSDGPLYLTMDCFIGSWVVIEDPSFRRSFNDRSNRSLLLHPGKVKSQEAAATTASPPQSNEGSDEADFDGDNPPADNLEEGNDDAEESGDDDTNAEESGDKDSAAEKPNKQVGDSEPATTPEARSKRWFLQGSRDVYYVGLNLNE